jgi:hypothetical protein
MANQQAAASNIAAASSTSVSKPPKASTIVVGKDVLELLSSAMYVDPLSIYREYVQNAGDSIEDARALGLLKETEGRVDIAIDTDQRSLRVRDNGVGIPVAEAERRLLAIGASTKRGTRARGFRGVGRLAGLAYARSLTFRTRSRGDNEVAVIRWDCQRLKTALRDIEQDDDVASVMQRVVTVTKLPGDDWPEHFFEVELNDVIRTRRDSLLSPTQVRDYLEQVAPVPFDGRFSFGEEITTHLAPVRMGNLDIRINDAAEPVRRPFRDQFKVSATLDDELSELELITLPDLDGGIAAVGWLLHHGYLGSITVQARIGGLRARVGNVQVGADDLLTEIFPEARFNGWTVGEIHIIDPRILPNARRDNFEQNIHYSNVTAQLEPLGRQIARRARSASVARNEARKVEAKRLLESNFTGSATATADSKEAAVTVSQSTPASGSHIASDRGTKAQINFIKDVRTLMRRANLSVEDVRQALLHIIQTES